MRLTAAKIAHAKNFQQCYQRLVAAAGAYDEVLASLRERSATINYEHRITGNGVLDAIEKLVSLMRESRRVDVQGALDRFIASQILIPGQQKPLEVEPPDQTRRGQLLVAMQEQVEGSKETI